MLGSAASAINSAACTIGSAAAAAIGSAAGEEVCKYGQDAINNMVCKVDEDLEDNYERLKKEVKKLCAMKDDILAQPKTKWVTQECNAWISRVNESEKEVQELETNYNEGKSRKRPWGQFFSRLRWSRTELGKRVAEKCKKVHKLCLEGIRFEKVPERVISMHTQDLTIEEILGHLRDKDVKRIGLWGMAGIGKTTIMQNLNNNEDIAEMFDIVIWVDASKVSSLKELQDTIATRLKLNLEGTMDCDISKVAALINKELKCTRYLLLLDEVREAFDLHLIGIFDSQKDGKVVLATRYRDICSGMEADEQINVKRLCKADAWKMFKERVGRNVNLPGIEPIAELVVRECAGLPLLIDKVARVFSKMDNFPLWSDGLRSLRRWPSVKVKGLDDLVESLKFCYGGLDDDSKKACFLYVAIYSEECEIRIDCLLECWRAEGFIHDANGFREACDTGHSILHDLINVSLLERGEKINHVRMNKVLRNMALNISSQRSNFKILVKPCEGLRETPNEIEWKQANQISFMDNKLCTLPETPDCNKLSTLLLQRNPDLIVIPVSFFGRMQNLRVLDLHGTGIMSLPSSISCLNHLSVLYLNYCNSLMDLHYLEGLELLEVLDIRDTSINMLPIQIGRLIQLKCLRMSLSDFMANSTYVEFFQNLFPILTLLEELQIDVRPSLSCEVIMKAIIDGVATLRHLTSLSIFFPTVNCLETFISKSPVWKDFRFTFQFSVGYRHVTSYQILDCFEYQRMRCLKFSNGEGVDPTISVVLSETDAFELISHKRVSRLSDFGMDSLNRMRGCLIEGCDDIETIVSGAGIARSALKCLEKMFINNAPKLECIWEGPVYAGSLSQLTTLTLCQCLKLKNIFSNGMIEQLSNLKHLKVEECPEIEEIITESENLGLKSDALPSLKMLVLSNLPKVNSIWIDESLTWPSLEKIEIFLCQMLRKLPFNNENAINLRRIEARQSWWSALVWQDTAIERRLQSIWFQPSS